MQKTRASRSGRAVPGRWYLMSQYAPSGRVVKRKRWFGAGRLRLLRTDADAEPSRRPADAFVQAEQLESGNGGSRDQHGREMYRVESSNRIAWKRLSRALDDLRTDP